MVKLNILIVDNNPAPCTAGGCNKLSNLIRNFSLPEELYFQVTSSFPFDTPILSPDLIIFLPAKETFSEVFHALKKKWNKVPVLCLFCDGWNTTSEILQLLFVGMDDYLSCPFKEIDLLPRVQRLLYGKNSESTHGCTGKAKDIPHPGFLIGKSNCFLQEVRKVTLLANSDATVLISGETGTGKELFARAIHYNSPRHGKPFIPVNCGALPEHLFENELFGHVKGAFTDASSTERGLVAEAEGGTIFLDEINALSFSAQTKLLRFLQSREYRPLGSSKNIVADVLTIVATNTNLKQKIDAGLFREDLYYRLNALSLSLPPLRERVGDISVLTDHFILKYAIQHSRHVHGISSDGLQKLLNYHWPGNVRELEGVIRRAVIMSSFSVLRPDDLDLPIVDRKNTSNCSSFQVAKAVAITDFERTYLTSILATHQGNITQAARAAGKERRAFQRLLQKYHLNHTTFRKAI